LEKTARRAVATVLAVIDERQLDAVFLEWHEAAVASCDVADPDELERAVVDQVIAVALSLRLEPDAGRCLLPA
jgi:hypothetical protein